MAATRKRYSAEAKARAIAYANLHGRAEASKTLGVPLRTLQRWVPENVAEMAPDGARALPEIDDRWARRVLGASVAVLEAGAAQLLDKVASGGEISPKDVHAWAGVMKLANDAETTRKLLDERKTQNNSQAAQGRPRPAPLVAVKAEGRAA